MTTRTCLTLGAAALLALTPLSAAQSAAPNPGSVGDSLRAQWDTFWAWVHDNFPTILLAVILVLLLVLLILWLSQRLPQKGLKRDALEIFRRDMLASTRAAEVRGKTLWLTGNEIFPPIRVGRLVGYTRDVEALWYGVKRGLFAKPELICCNPDDLASSHEGREIHVRGVGLRHHRGAYFVVPDVHDPRERAIWTRAAGTHEATAAAADRAPRALETASDLAEFFKEYFTSAVDSIVMVDSSLVATEDVHFLRRYVTLGKHEYPSETLVTKAAPPTVGNQQAGDQNA